MAVLWHVCAHLNKVAGRTLDGCHVTKTIFLITAHQQLAQLATAVDLKTRNTTRDKGSSSLITDYMLTSLNFLFVYP